MKVLVTGGAGFIGSHVVDNLVARGVEVTVFDRFPQQHRHADNVHVFFGDVRDENAVIEAVALHDGVIHLAAILGTQETVPNPRPTIETNIFGSLNVFQAIRMHKKRGVYIAVGNWWMNNPYSITKTTAERFALMFNREFRTEIAVVRGLNVYGPRQKDKPVRKITPNLVVPALRGSDITLYGDGEQVMDMIYVTDIAEILVRALLNDHGVYDSVFQAGMGQNTTINYLAELVVKLTGSRSKIVRVPMRPGETPRSVVKADPASWQLESLGWDKQDFVSLEEGLKRTIDWYRENYAV